MIGKRISHYEVLSRLGEGGMGVVYLARDLKIEDRKVVLKFPQIEASDHPEEKERFRREAYALARIDHPNVCVVHELIETDGMPSCIAMAWCEGRTLGQWAHEETPDTRAILRVLRQAAAGLAAAHKQSIIHRDIKPSNIMVQDDQCVKLVDFGLARLLQRSAVDIHGGVRGTPRYIAPELIEGQRGDIRSDLYSLGVVAFELITQRPLFDAESPGALIAQILEGPPRILSAAEAEGLPDTLVSLLYACLEKDPEKRVQSADAVVDYLSQAEAELEQNSLLNTRRIEPERSRSTRRYWAPTFVTLLLVGLAAFSAGKWATREVPAESAIALISNEDSREDPLVAGLLEVVGGRLSERSAAGIGPAFLPSAWFAYDRLSNSRSIFSQTGCDIVGTISYSDVADSFHLEWRGAASRFLGRVSWASEDPLWPSVGDLVAPVAGLKEVWEKDSHALPSPRELEERGRFRLGEEFSEAQMLALARRATQEGDLGAAALYAESILSRGPPDSLTGLLILHLYESKTDEGRSRRLLAQAALGEGDPQRALDWVEPWLEEYPTDYAALALVQRAARENGEAERATRWLQRAVDAEPESLPFLERLGAHLYRHGEYDASLPPLQRALQLAPNYPNCYNVVGASLFMIDCWESAVEAWEASLALERSWSASSNLGLVYYMQGRWAESIELLRWALQYRPESESALSTLGSALWMSGRRDEATEIFWQLTRQLEARIQASPGNASDRIHLAGTLAVLDPDRARKELSAALALPGELDADSQFRLVTLYTDLGDFNAALEQLRAYLAGQPSIRWVEAEPFLAPLRATAAYRHLMATHRENVPDCPSLELPAREFPMPGA